MHGRNYHTQAQVGVGVGGGGRTRQKSWLESWQLDSKNYTNYTGSPRDTYTNTFTLFCIVYFEKACFVCLFFCFRLFFFPLCVLKDHHQSILIQIYCNISKNRHTRVSAIQISAGGTASLTGKSFNANKQTNKQTNS